MFFDNFYNLLKKSDNGLSKCLVLGTSRIGLAIDSNELAEGIKWDSKQILKAPISAGSAWEVVKLMNSEKEAFKDVKCIIIDAEAYQFNDNCPTRFGHRFYRLANIKEKMILANNWKEESVVMIDEIWPLLSDRRTLNEWFLGTFHYVSKGKWFIPMDKRWDKYEKNPELFQEEMFDPKIAAKRHMEKYSYSFFMERTWEELVNICNQRGISLTIIIPPAKREFVEALQAEKDWETGYKQMMKFLKSLDRYPLVNVIITETFADIGYIDDETFFIDYGHMSHKGAIIYSCWLSKKISYR